MKLIFLGTRANTDGRTRRHRRHSALLVCFGQARVMIDCGADWLGRIEQLAPDAIVVTHAHPDHAWGLRKGALRPVFATTETWRLLAGYPFANRHVIAPRSPTNVAGIVFEAFTVDHSVRAPAVGYRVSAGGRALFYAPHVVAIPECGAALAGIDLYVGDGSTFMRPMVRRKGKVLFGHTTVRAQLGWCQKEGVPCTVFTHCGSEVLSDALRLGREIEETAHLLGVKARFAYDGLEIAMS